MISRIKNSILHWPDSSSRLFNSPVYYIALTCLLAIVIATRRRNFVGTLLEKQLSDFLGMDWRHKQGKEPIVRFVCLLYKNNYGLFVNRHIRIRNCVTKKNWKDKIREAKRILQRKQRLPNLSAFILLFNIFVFVFNEY